MEGFRSFFKDSKLNNEGVSSPMDNPVEKVVPFVKTTRHGKHIRDADRLAYQRAWVAAKRRRLSGKAR